jgi:hypothetical protein
MWDIGGKAFSLCLICQFQTLLTRFARCFEEQGQRARLLDAQEGLRVLKSAIADRKAAFSSSPSPDGES